MNLLPLTVAGTLTTVAVMGLDLAFATTIEARSRRFWWLTIPLAFLLPFHFPLLPSTASLPIPPSSEIVVPLGEVLGFSSPEAPPSHEIPYLQLLWAGGALLSLSRLAFQVIRTSLWWRRERLSSDAHLLSMLEDCKNLANIPTPVALVVSDRIATPALLGWIRPRILLPRTLIREIPEPQLRAILLHELAHLAAFDIPSRWLFLIARSLHWFNPLAHLATRRWIQFQEEAADEKVIQWMRIDTASDMDTPEEIYLESLLTALHFANSSPAPVPPSFGTLSTVDNSTEIKSRIMKIQNQNLRLPRFAATFSIAALLLAGITLRPMHGADSTSPATTAEDPAKQEAVKAMQTWLSLIDQGQYAKSWAEASAFFKANVSEKQWQQACQSVRVPLGRLKSRTLASALHQQEIPMPDGTLKKVDAVIAQFNTSFENLASARETVTFEREKDGSWRASGYYVKPQM